MRKNMFVLMIAGSLLISGSLNNTHSENTINLHSSTLSADEMALSFSAVQNEYAFELNALPHEVEQVASSSATAKTGSYKFRYNTNVRLDAGTKSKVLLVAKKGAAATATHQKKVGGQVWYKVKASGKHGWVLSTLLSPKTAAVKAPTSSKAAASASGSYKVKYNSNVRANAGTNHRIVTLAKKSSVVKATSSKKVGSTTWFKITANGKTGWISGALLTKTTAAKTPAKASPKAKAATGSYKVNYNSNVRANAGTGYKIVTLAKNGSVVKATSSKKVGSTTWFKVTANGKTGWISGALLTKTTAAKVQTVSKASNSASPSAIVSTALSLKGIPYRFGGTTTAGFDCSGFIQYVFKQQGISVSRTTLSQFAETAAVTSPKPGDLVFFANTYRAGISHVGIYIGNNQFVHSGGAKAEVKSLNDVYWGPKFHSFKRF